MSQWLLRFPCACFSTYVAHAGLKVYRQSADYIGGIQTLDSQHRPENMGKDLFIVEHMSLAHLNRWSRRRAHSYGPIYSLQPASPCYVNATSSGGAGR